MLPHVVICDLSADYAARLESKFLSTLRNGIDLEVITDQAYFRDYFSSSVDIDVLLVAESLYSTELSRQDIRRLFILTEDAKTGVEPPEGATYIYKYTNRSHVFNQAMGPYLRQGGSTGDGPAKVLLFFSPIGGSGKSTLAAGVAATLQEAGSRVLAVDAEYLQEWGSLFPDVKRAPGQAAIALARGDESPYEAMREYVAHEAVDVLTPMPGNIMTYGVSFDVYAHLIVGARESGEYDYVVVDTDSAFNEEKVRLLGTADSVVVSTSAGLGALRKCASFIEGLDNEGRQRCHLIANAWQVGADGEHVGEVTGLPSVEARVSYDPRIPEMSASELSHVDDIRTVSYLVR